MLRTLIESSRAWVAHAGWLVATALLLLVAVLLTPGDSLAGNMIDPLRLVWKLAMVLSAAWLAYQLARSVLPRELRLDVLLDETGDRKPDTYEQHRRTTALICAVVIGRLLFMGLVAIAVSGGV